jgi:aryl-alcohol dehydrogenase-like predicted oxidoreductase
MKNRSGSGHSAQMPNADAATLRATSAGTTRLVQRHASQFVPDFFRTLGNDLIVSSIGIGSYLGEATDAHDEAYELALGTAVRAGINLIDTAINYRCQRSERSIGAGVQQLIASGDAARDELVICTKGGYIPLDDAPPPTREAYQEYVKREFIDQQILRPDEIVAGGHSLATRFLRYCIAKSRQNLGLRTIDIYYLHNPGQQLASVDAEELMRRIEAAFVVLEEAVSRGEIGSYGLATWDSFRVMPGQANHLSLEAVVGIARKVAGDAHHFRTVQLPLNLAMPEAVKARTQVVSGEARTLVEAASELGVDVVASASLMQSNLASGLPAEVRGYFPGAATDAQAAIEFVRSAPGVLAALVGMKSSAHVNENLGAVHVGGRAG